MAKPSPRLRSGGIVLFISAIIQSLGLAAFGVIIILGLTVLHFKGSMDPFAALMLLLAVPGTVLLWMAYAKARRGDASGAYRLALASSLMPPVQILTLIGAFMCKATTEAVRCPVCGRTSRRSGWCTNCGVPMAAAPSPDEPAILAAIPRRVVDSVEASSWPTVAQRPLRVFIPWIVLLSLAVPTFFLLTTIEFYKAGMFSGKTMPLSAKGFFFDFAYLVSLAAQAVVTGLWLQRAAENLRAARVPGLRWSPGWGLGGWLIPYAWWVLPYLFIREVWKASQPGSSGTVAWRERPMPAWIAVWWTCWVLWIPLGLVPVVWGTVGGLSPTGLLLAFVPAAVVFVVAGVLFLSFVLRLTKLQDQGSPSSGGMRPSP